LQGTVNFGDFQLLSQYFGMTGTTWDEGDFTYNGTTDFGDFQLLSENFGKTSSALTGGDSPGVVNRPGPNFGHGQHQANPAAATVTLNIAASGGSWTAYADNSSGDNAGLASFDIDVAGSGGLSVTSSFNDAPSGGAFIGRSWVPVGFTELASNGNGDTGSGGNGIAISAGQNTMGSLGVIQTFGQESGSEYGLTWTQTDLGVDIASGTYSGTSGTLTVDVDGDGFIQTLDEVEGSNWYGPDNISFANVDPGSVTVGDPGDALRGGIGLDGLGNSFNQDVGVVPEPASASLFAVAGFGLMARRRSGRRKI
jgi:hypothetical protein